MRFQLAALYHDGTPEQRNCSINQFAYTKAVALRGDFAGYVSQLTISPSKDLNITPEVSAKKYNNYSSANAAYPIAPNEDAVKLPSSTGSEPESRNQTNAVQADSNPNTNAMRQPSWPPTV